MDIFSIEGNERRIKELKDKANIVPFIGAGMSYGCFPLWKDFLLKFDLLDSEKKEVEKLLLQGDYEEAASFIQKQVGVELFIDKVKEIFSSNKINADRIPNYTKMLPQLDCNLIVTTNLDQVIEYVFEKKGNNIIKICPNMHDMANYAIESKQMCLIKLHGSVEESTTYVLTKEQYDKAYGIDSYKHIDFSNPFVSILSRLMVSKTLLFLGCSLASDRTLHVLDQIFENQKQYIHHYAVMSMNECNEKNIMLERRLAKYGIFVIWIPSGEYSSIEQVLRLLIRKGSENKIINTLPRINKNLVGRESEIDELKKK